MTENGVIFRHFRHIFRHISREKARRSVRVCAEYRPPGSTLGYRFSTPEHRGKVYLKAKPPSTRGDAAPSISPTTHRMRCLDATLGAISGIDRRRGAPGNYPGYAPLSVPQERRCHIRYFLWSSSEGRNTLDSLGKTAALLTSVRHRTEHKKDPLEMRLGKPRGGGGTVTTTITLELRALKGSGCFP